MQLHVLSGILRQRILFTDSHKEEVTGKPLSSSSERGGRMSVILRYSPHHIRLCFIINSNDDRVAQAERPNLTSAGHGLKQLFPRLPNYDYVDGSRRNVHLHFDPHRALPGGQAQREGHHKRDPRQQVTNGRTLCSGYLQQQSVLLPMLTRF